jgi:predicted ATPase/signal transduction histidine kinase
MVCLKKKYPGNNKTTMDLYHKLETIRTLYQSLNYQITHAFSISQNQNIIIKTAHQENLAPALAEQLEKEKNLQEKINSNQFLKILDFINYKNQPALIYEYFEGELLADFLQTANISLIEKLTIITQIAQGLRALHAQNIIHNFLNPYHILINSKTLEIKIFGLEYAFISPYAHHEPLSHYTKEILAYISPEQTGRTQKEIDFRSDIYALGIIFYQLLTDQLPFTSDDLLEIVHAQIAKIPVNPQQINKNIPLPMAQIVLKCLEKNSFDRYQTAHGLNEDLKICIKALKNKKNIPDFTLAKKDIPNIFQISPKLYGRQKEVQTLVNTFQKAGQGQTVFGLVAGTSGIGKTVLINELLKPIILARSFFVTGKFEKMKKYIPYFAFIQAINELIKQILAQKEEDYNAIVAEIKTSLGSNAQVLVELIPQLTLLIGPQPPVPKLNPLETKNRFNMVMQSFLKLFSKINKPLVLFLDDLQWADAASLELIKIIITSSDSPNYFVLGAYRDNEVSQAHILQITLKEIQEIIAQDNELRAKVEILNLKVKALQKQYLNQLIADSLYLNKNQTNELTDIVFQKTKGNPFYIKQILNKYYLERGIFYDQKKYCWHWQLRIIKEISVPEDMAIFMTAQIKELAPKTQEILKIAACLGFEFDLNLLAQVCKEKNNALQKDLAPALSQGIIFYIDSLYDVLQKKKQQEKKQLILRFSHDKVYQAVYSLLDKQTKIDIHYQIGQLLQKHKTAQEIEHDIFDVVRHFNTSLSKITNEPAKLTVIKYNLVAGAKAFSSLAYDGAYAYYAIAKDLLGTNAWLEKYQLTRTTYLGLAKSAFLQRKDNLATQLFAKIVDRSKNEIERGQIYNLQMTLATLKGEPVKAIEYGLNGLNKFKLKIKIKPSSLDILINLLKVLFLLRKYQISDLAKLPKMHHPSQLAKINLLMNLTGPAYQFNQNLFTLVIIKMVELSLKYGNSEFSPYAYAAYGIIAGSGLNKYGQGFALAQVAEQMNKKINNLAIFSRIYLAMGGMINPWIKHLKSTQEILAQSIKYGIRSGDLIYASWSIFFIVNNAFLSGIPLAKVEALIKQYINYAKNDQAAINFVLTTRQMIRCLYGQTKNPMSFTSDDFDEPIYQDFVRKIKPPAFWFFVNKTMLFYLFGAYHQAYEAAQEAQKYIKESIGTFWVSEYYFYTVLSLIELCRHARFIKKYRYQKIIKKYIKKIAYWQHLCPENFTHKYYLLKAMVASIKPNCPKFSVLKLFNEAIAFASKYEYLQIYALANEKALEFLHNYNLSSLAENYFIEARIAYDIWGASSKVSALKEKYAPLFFVKSEDRAVAPSEQSTTKPVTKAAASFDIATVIKASQVISKEIVLAQLVGKLMHVIIENAGSTYGALLLISNNELVLEAVAKANKKQVKTYHIKNISQSLVPLELLNYVRRTKNTFLYLENEQGHSFAKDIYFKNNQPKSILCLPILKQNKEVLGLIYLENNLISSAFDEQRINLLNIIATQAAISIENAQLYEKTQKLVHELELSNAQTQKLNIELQDLNKNLEKRVIEEVDSRKKALDVAQKLSYQAALSTLNAGITHEINNPLGIMENDIFLLKEVLDNENIVLTKDNLSQAIANNAINIDELWADLVEREYIDDEGHISNTFRPQYRHYNTKISEVFHKEQDKILKILHDKFRQDRIVKYVSRIEKNLNRTRHITNTMLKQSRAESGDKEKLKLQDVLEEFETMLKGTCLNNNVTLMVDIPEEDIYILGDPISLNQVFVNLGKNAIQAMEQNSSSKPKCIYIDVQKETFTNEDGQKIPGILIAIKDTGCGINKEDIDKIFDPFFTKGKQRSEGSNTGLGLSIVLKIIAEHQGLINVESEKEIGTTFKINLPLV